ncbi:MAG: hypothetical protein V4543_14785 [Bacteroidota bacterium]
MIAKGFVALIALLVLIPGSAYAQQTGEPGNSGPSPAAAAQVPIDGGASLLAAAGISYGIKRIRNRKKAKALVSPER